MEYLFVLTFIICLALMSLGATKYRLSAGLPLTYFIMLSIIHVPGALLYSEYAFGGSVATWTQRGFELTVVGCLSFVLSVVSMRFVLPPVVGVQKPFSAPPRYRLANICIVIGLFCLAFNDKLAGIPTVNAIASTFVSLVVVGAWKRLWLSGEVMNDNRRWRQTVIWTPLLPMFTILNGGFAASGLFLLVAIGSFVLSQSKKTRLLYLIAGPIVVVFAMSFFVNYMAARNELRKLVWTEQADALTRISRLATVFTDFNWLDFSSDQQRQLIDSRLNQNILVGQAAARLDAGEVEYAHGDTFRSILFAMIPRVIWPEKPVVGGGGNVVEKYTGQTFAAGTSVGAGQVLEFFVNFGTPGVIFGFAFFGILMAIIDLRVMNCLAAGDDRGFLIWSLVGVSLINPGGNLVEIFVTAISAAVGAYGLGFLLVAR